jgi:hypothetical protein
MYYVGTGVGREEFRTKHAALNYIEECDPDGFYGFTLHKCDQLQVEQGAGRPPWCKHKQDANSKREVQRVKVRGLKRL